ncbi:hypothetical protein BCR32DRAFT_161510 [Anaeromyces robustus]|uniref:CCDC113/CCDC96 coiled-coil domain-containing protein n=1 Tax=Anaeromyces robustus TaxID=1754192 RepID=A0A1Y1XNV4_9FUNG|nr:hypothetical protein BCR32DRAFT_161510 [Anaeromyces robustus]|eukprot:ORX87413.1 hypothetical protein BCR32DRAFT_161510 [Anaeromyces robustus]
MFNDYGFSDSDIDYYDEPLIKDVMTPPIIDENATFTWIPQLSDYLDDVKQALLIKAKKEQDDMIRERELRQEEEEEEEEEKKENESEKKEGDEEENKENEKNSVSEDSKQNDILTSEEQENKEDSEKLEGDNKKGENDEKTESEDDKQPKILTDDDLLKNIENNLDISNIIDEPILSFGINHSRLIPDEDMMDEEEEEEYEIKEEEDEKRNEEFMNETFEILRSETPIDNEKIDEFADYFVNDNDELANDLDGSKNSIHSSKDAFDLEDDNENKEENTEENKNEVQEEEEEDKVSNVIDREQFIENLKTEIEKYERNNTKNLFLQNKLYELFRKKRPDEHRDGDKSLNDQEQRYLGSMYEYKELKNEYDDINNKKQEIANSHKEKLQDKKQEAEKLYQEFYKQKQHIAQNAKSTRTGNEFSLKVFEQLEGMEKKKDEMVTIARLENIRLQNKLRRQESLLRQKEELADGLHLIDFEQLKIENQTYNEKIEERNEV